MRKNRLLALALAALSTVASWAQTDVTDQYITNADFAQDVANKFEDKTVGDVTGWTGTSTVTWYCSATFNYGSTAKPNGYALPTTNPDGESPTDDGMLYFGCRWGSSIIYTSSSEVTLPAGNYTITVPVYSMNSSCATIADNYIGWVPTDGDAVYATTKSFTYGKWTNVIVAFNLTEDTKGKFSIGVKGNSAAIGGCALLAIDGITLTYSSIDKSALLTAINAAQTAQSSASIGDAIFQKPQTAGDALASAIEEAQKVYDNADATQAEVDAATSAIETATSTFESTAVNVPDESTPYSIKHKASSLYLYLDGSASGNATITSTDTPFYFKTGSTDGAYYITDGTNYVGINGDWDTRANSTDKADLAIGAVTLEDALCYQMKTAKGYIGSDATTGGSSLYSNKGATNANTYWIITEYDAADEDDYKALQAAIDAANTIVEAASPLGFDEGEYAPYNGAALLQALEAAEAIDQTKVNQKTTVQEATAALEAANKTEWNANTEEVNAFFDGTFEKKTATGTDADAFTQLGEAGWSDSNKHFRRVYKDATKFPIIADADGSTFVFTWPINSSVVYGEQTGYTMPLKASTTYRLTYKCGSWEAGTTTFNATVADADGNAVATQETTTSVNTNSTDATEFTDVEIIFTTTEAGNYTFKLTSNANGTVTDFYLFRLKELTLDETELEAITTEATNIDVTLDRDLVKGWNSIVLPFDVDAATAASVIRKRLRGGNIHQRRKERRRRVGHHTPLHPRNRNHRQHAEPALPRQCSEQPEVRGSHGEANRRTHRKWHLLQLRGNI